MPVQAKGSRGPWLWPLALAAVGLVLLLDNFLLLEGFNPTRLWPLLLVVIGAQILLRGDVLPDADSKTFGVTRGSVEAAVLDVSAGPIDVQARALQREGRLIAGQYAGQSRPHMSVNGARAYIRMDRSAVPWLSFADWEMGLARDLPWQLFVSTHLGQVNLDLAGLIVEEAVIGSGVGDIRLVCPREALGPLRLRSALGSIQVITPHGCQAVIHARNGRFSKVHADFNRYSETEPGVFVAHDADDDAPLVEVFVQSTFGDTYLA
jgi:hypothetical protein